MSNIIDQNVTNVSRPKQVLARKVTHTALVGGIVAMLTLLPANPRDANALVGGVVFDPTNFYANIQQFYQTVEQVRTAYQQLEAQYKQLNTMTSKSYWTEQMPQYKSWTPATWQDIQRMIEAGLNPGDAGDAEAYMQAKQRYQKRYPRLKQEQIASSENAVQWTEYTDTYDATSSALAATEAVQEQIKTYKQTIATLREQAAQSGASDELKASVDLTNNMLLQMLSLQLDQMQLSQHTLNMSATSANSRQAGRVVNATFLDSRPSVRRTP